MISSLNHLRERGPEECRLVDDLVARIDGCGECARRVWINLVERYLPCAPSQATAQQATSFAEDRAMYWIAVGLEAGSRFTRLCTGGARGHGRAGGGPHTLPSERKPV